MKKLYLGIIILLCSYARVFAQCESITLGTQAQVDSFQSTYGCTTITGNLIILSGDGITHLDSLYSLQSVGNLRIFENRQLTSLHGLEGLTNVTDIEISANNLLTDLSGLDNLETVGRAINIYNNPALTSLHGLEKLRHVNNNVNIGSNASLTSLDGLQQLEHPGSLALTDNPALTDVTALSSINAASTLWLRNNGALVSLQGLHNITRLWALYISLNRSLTSLDDLSALDSVTTDIQLFNNQALASIAGLNGIRQLNDLQIMQNNSLTNVDGLNTLTTVRDLRFDNNPVLENLDGLSGLRTMRGIRLFGNSALEDVDGLSSVESAETVYAYYNESLRNLNGLSGLSGTLNEITVWNNPSIENVDAFHGITVVAGGLNIAENKVLQNINGLSAITKVEGGAIFQSNAILTNLDGLSSLKEIGGELFIDFNPVLVNLNGLSALETVGGLVSIRTNSALTSLDGLSSLRSAASSFRVNENPQLENIRGLRKLRSIGAGLQIMGNKVLTSLEGLDSLTSIGNDLDPSYYSVWIQDNDALTTLKGFGPIKTLSGSLVIGENALLHDLDGLDSLTSIAGERASLMLANNASLANIDGLSKLKEVYNGGVLITGNGSLVNLDGLKSLTTIYSNEHAHLTVHDNDALNDLDGLSSLTTISGARASLLITNNASLTRCCGLYPILHYDGVHGPGGETINIAGNAAGCTREDIEAGGPCEGIETVEQPTDFTFTAVTDTSMHIAFTPPVNPPDGYITLMSENGWPYPEDRPWDGGTYFVGQKIGNSTVVTYGTMTETDLTGLAPNRTYYFHVFSYSEGYDGGNGNDYLTIDPLAASQMTGATPNEGITFSNVTASTMTVSFTPPSSGAAGYLLLMRAYGSPYPDDVPADGTGYNVGNSIGSSSIVVGVGTATSHNIVYLEPGTRYYFNVFSYSAGYDYDTASPLAGNDVTLMEDPGVPGDTLAQPTNIAFTNVTDNSMTVSFTAPAEAPDGYITLMRAFGSPSPEDVPADGTSYNVGNVIGSSTIVVGRGTATSLNVVYLSPNTEYYFDVYSFMNTSGGPDYLTTGPLAGHRRTSEALALAAPFPNPFVDDISIPFTTTEDNTFVKVIVHDHMGKKVAEVVSDSFARGYHEVKWDRRDHNGNRIGNGMYVYSIVSTGGKQGASGVIVAK